MDVAIGIEPVNGVKISRLVIHRLSGDIVFAPMFRRRAPLLTFSAHSRAGCGRFGAHPAPHVGCSCGFYAVASDTELDRLGPLEKDAVIVDVDLGGRVVEHELGVRAEVQAVRRVRVPNRCGRCDASGVEGFMLRHDTVSFKALTPVCAKCMAHCTLWHRRRCVPLTWAAVVALMSVTLELWNPVSGVL